MDVFFSIAKVEKRHCVHKEVTTTELVLFSEPDSWQIILRFPIKSRDQK